MMSCSVLFVSPKNEKKDVNMNKESKCFDLNSKQKKNYAKWKRFIKNLSHDKPNEKESKNKEKEKKTFEDYFSINTIIKSVNNFDYEPILRA